jgi:uncharacterized protein YrrD
VEDLGPPASYLTLRPGAPVYYSEGEGLGRVSRVLAELDKDIFEGIEVDPGPLSRRRFVAAGQVDEIYERGVVLSIDSSQGETLPDAE